MQTGVRGKQRSRRTFYVVMNIEFKWNEVTTESSSASYCGYARVAEIHSAKPTSYAYVESFMTDAFHVIVQFNAVPIKSFAVELHALKPESLKPENVGNSFCPHRLHFGLSFKSIHEWSNPQDVFFQQSASVGSYIASHSFPTESMPNGISFVIQLFNHEWIRDQCGRDFHAGYSPSCPPSCVELPLPWPIHPIIDNRVLALHRNNPFWLVPHFPRSLSGCRNETFCVLAEVESTHSPLYVAVIFCVDPSTGLRTSLFSTSSSDVGVRLETGLCYPIRASVVGKSLLACLACDGDPFGAIQNVVNLMMQSNVNVCSSMKKRQSLVRSSISSPLLSRLGYCTWDAFGNHVSMTKVVDAINWLRNASIPIGYTIVDDGWQNVQPADSHEDQPVLTQFSANKNFKGSLRHTADNVNASIYAWTTVLGYWGGLSMHDQSTCHIHTLLVSARQARGLFINDVEDASLWERTYQLPHPSPQNLRTLFTDYFVKSMSQHQHIAGVKIDSQSVLDLLCNIKDHAGMTRLKLNQTYRDSFTMAVEEAFPGSVVINCMACGPEAILSSGRQLSASNVCWRTSNDHAFPGVAEGADSVCWHVLTNVMTTLFLGNIFPLPDWDMFRVCDNCRLAKIHGVARVVSGGPIYISDITPFDSKMSRCAIRLLQSLTTHDGYILRCYDVGRPTADCLFEDPRLGMDSNCANPKLLKVFNRNAVNGILAIFNLNSPNRVKQATGAFCPADIRDFNKNAFSKTQFVSLVNLQINDFAGQSFVHQDKSHKRTVTMEALDVVAVHISPVLKVARGIRFSAIGQQHVLNSGGVIDSIAYEVAFETVTIDVFLKDYGGVLLWMKLDSNIRIESVRTSAGFVDAIVLNNEDLINVEVPQQKPYEIQLLFHLQG